MLSELYVYILSFCDARISVFMSRVCKQFHTISGAYTSEIIEKIRQKQNLDYIVCSFQDLDYVSTTMELRKVVVNRSYGDAINEVIHKLLSHLPSDITNFHPICPLYRASKEKKCILSFLEDNHYCDKCKTEQDLFRRAASINLPSLLAYYQPDTLKSVKIAKNYIYHYGVVNLDILLQYLLPRQCWTDMILLSLLFWCAEVDSYECYKVIDKHFKYGSLDMLYKFVCMYISKKEGDFHKPLHSLYNLGYNGENIDLLSKFCFWCTKNVLKEIEEMITRI